MGDRPVELRVGEVRLLGRRLDHVRVGEVRIGEVNVVHVGRIEIRVGEVESRKAATGEVEPTRWTREYAAPRWPLDTLFALLSLLPLRASRPFCTSESTRA